MAEKGEPRLVAAQFESYINPLVIMLTVPLAIAGGLLGIYVTDATLNPCSQIGLIMLVGLAATFFTLFVVPVAYGLLYRRSRIPGEVARRLEREQAALGRGLAN